jgi:hypothetical protein
VKSSPKKKQGQSPGCLHIGAVNLAISCPPAVSWQNPDPLYRAFFPGLGAGKNYSRMQIRLVLGKMPDLRGMQKLFDTRESWSIYSDVNGYWISFHPASHPHPFWIARFDRQAGQVIVYCGSPLLLAAGENKINLANPICYPLDQILFMYHLAYRDGILIHASGIDLDGQGLIFPGCSGAGKSTLARLFATCQAGKLLSDERVVVRGTGSGWQIFGTPWAGTENIAGNGRAPLAGMYFLKHGEHNRLRVLTAENAMERLLPALSIPWYDSEVMARIVLIGKNLVARVPVYELTFKADPGVVDFLVKSLLIGNRP